MRMQKFWPLKSSRDGVPDASVYKSVLHGFRDVQMQVPFFDFSEKQLESGAHAFLMSTRIYVLRCVYLAVPSEFHVD